MVRFEIARYEDGVVQSQRGYPTTLLTARRAQLGLFSAVMVSIGQRWVGLCSLISLQAFTLIDLLCAYFNCKHSRLGEILKHPKQVRKATLLLRGKKCRTLHLRNNRIIKFGDFSSLGADKMVAYEGYCDRLTVKQHFYARHRIALLYPRLPCAIYYHANGPGHNSYYPLEVLSLCLIDDI